MDVNLENTKHTYKSVVITTLISNLALILTFNVSGQKIKSL